MGEACQGGPGTFMRAEKSPVRAVAVPVGGLVGDVVVVVADGVVVAAGASSLQPAAPATGASAARRNATAEPERRRIMPRSMPRGACRVPAAARTA